MSLLEARNLTKTYGNVSILKNITLTVEKGEMIAVMGPSGSGKSTLLYNISGMERPDAGETLLNGTDMTCLHEKALAELRLKKMGFIFQHMHLLQSLSVMDNIILPAYFAKMEKRGAINSKAASLMAQTGINHIADSDISEISGGELQRAAICRALINNPEIIFGDEPTGALNSKATADVMNMLVEINRKGTSIMLVSHDTRVAAYADSVYFMCDGEISGKLTLEKYNGEHSAREAKVTQWAIENGF